MNIETANRLFQYRKKRGLSQEGLAEKIGVSRQAVSKWERAEASPDTDNLIALAKVYGVTLDDLLTGGEAEIAAAPSSESHVPEESRDYKYQREPEGFSAQEEEDDYNYVKAEINIDDDFPGYEKRDDAHIFHFEVAKRKKDFWHKLPVPIIAVIVFFI